MKSEEIIRKFNESFLAASGDAPLHYMHLARFMTLGLLFVAVGFALVHFMGEEAKSSDAFVWSLGSRVFRLLLGLIFTIICLTI